MLTLNLTLNLAVAFGLELYTLIAFGRWGAQSGQTPAARVFLGAGAPLLMALFWGTWIAPRATIPVSPALRLLLQLLVFGLATAALVTTRQPVSAGIFGSLALLNLVSLQLLQPRTYNASRASEQLERP